MRRSRIGVFTLGSSSQVATEVDESLVEKNSSGGGDTPALGMGDFGNPSSDMAAFEEASYGSGLLSSFLLVAGAAIDFLTHLPVSQSPGDAISLQQSLEVLEVALSSRIEAGIATPFLITRLGELSHHGEADSRSVHDR